MSDNQDVKIKYPRLLDVPRKFIRLLSYVWHWEEFLSHRRFPVWENLKFIFKELSSVELFEAKLCSLSRKGEFWNRRIKRNFVFQWLRQLSLGKFGKFKITWGNPKFGQKLLSFQSKWNLCKMQLRISSLVQIKFWKILHWNDKIWIIISRAKVSKMSSKKSYSD